MGVGTTWHYYSYTSESFIRTVFHGPALHVKAHTHDLGAYSAAARYFELDDDCCCFFSNIANMKQSMKLGGWRANDVQGNIS